MNSSLSKCNDEMLPKPEQLFRNFFEPGEGVVGNGAYDKMKNLVYVYTKPTSNSDRMCSQINYDKTCASPEWRRGEGLGWGLGD